MTDDDELNSQDEEDSSDDTEDESPKSIIPETLINDQVDNQENQKEIAHPTGSSSFFRSSLNTDDSQKLKKETQSEGNETSIDSHSKMPKHFRSFIESIFIQDFLDDEY